MFFGSFSFTVCPLALNDYYHFLSEWNLCTSFISFIITLFLQEKPHQQRSKIFFMIKILQLTRKKHENFSIALIK